MVMEFVTLSPAVQMSKHVTMMTMPLRTMVLVSMLMLVESVEGQESQQMLVIVMAMSLTSAVLVEALALRKEPVTAPELCLQPTTIVMAIV